MHAAGSQLVTDANMNNGAWRLSRPLICTLIGTLISLPMHARADTAAEFVNYYQNASAQGRDLIPGPRTPLDTRSTAARLDLQSVSPAAVLSGSAFLSTDGTVIKLAGIKGCLSTERTEYAGLPATCTMISLAGMTMIVGEAKAGGGNAFPCHVFGQNPGKPVVRYAECFFLEDGAVQSLSEVLIRKGMAFAARDGAGRPIFPEYARAEEEARREKAGIWANSRFVHPYGERYRANPTLH
jgi:hypothetical protein